MKLLRSSLVPTNLSWSALVAVIPGIDPVAEYCQNTASVQGAGTDAHVE